jgi:AGZA family xanthine/uracil permease-like MFS transporter
MDKLGQVGVLYEGLAVMGGGSILGGLILAAIGAFMIDRKFENAAGFALAGAAFTFFGFMHGEAIGFAQSPVVALSYVSVAVVLFICGKYATSTPKAVETHVHHGAIGQPAS